MTVVNIPSGPSLDAVEYLSSSKREPEWMLERRREAWQTFEKLPLPTRRDEEWKYTDFSKLRLSELAPFASPSGDNVVSPLGLDGDQGGTLQQHNSLNVRRSLSPDLIQQGVVYTDLDSAVHEYPELVQKYFATQAVPAGMNAFAALNTALWSGGAFLYVPKNSAVTLPLHSMYGLTASGVGLFTHTLIVVERGASVTYVEEYVSSAVDGAALNAGVVEMILADDSHLTNVSLQDWGSSVFDISTQRAVIGRNSTLDWLVIGMGTGKTRANIEAALSGAGASTQMLGILWGSANQQTDYHTVQDHVAPHTTSDLLYKAALADQSKSIFSGRIRVEKGAQGTDAYQTNRSVLLSDKASAFPSPNLEIEANEVRCSHGASVGKVDQDQLFYLMSRGLSRDLATRIVVEGFFEEVLQREPVASIRDRLRDLLDRKITGR